LPSHLDPSKEGPAIGTEGYSGAKITGLSANITEGLTAGDIPQFNDTILVDGGHILTIGAKSHAGNWTFVILQWRTQGLKAGDIPHPNGLVLTARDQNFTIGAEG
jgi:hypothetical protein